MKKKYLLINTPWIIKQRSSAEFFSTIIIFALTISYLEDSRRELLWAEMKGLLFRSAARKCSQEIPTPPSDRWTISIWAKENERYPAFCLYSLVRFALFCLVKRIVQYLVKEWTEQKVSITDVVGLYSTYQKCIIIGAPNSYQFREKLTWVFYQKNLLKSKHFFYEK